MTAARGWWWLALALLAGVLVWLLAPVLMPFAVAGLLAYLGNPLVVRLTALRLPRTLAAVAVLCLILLLLASIPLLAFPLLERQIATLLRNWPGYISWVNDTLVPWLQAHLDLDVQALDLGAARDALMQHWQLAGGIAARLLAAITQSWLAVLAWLANLVLIPVITFYLLRDWEALLARIAALLPRYAEPTVSGLARECNEVLASFLRGQLWVMVGLGLVYSIGLWIAGLDLALLIGIAAGAVSFVPYLGLIVGLLAAGIAGLVQSGGDIAILLPVALVFGAGQLLESLVLTPLLVGDRIGLHPVAVIFAVLAGGQLFGALGVLLALPAAAVIVVLLRHAHQLYVDSHLYRETPGNGPEET